MNIYELEKQATRGMGPAVVDPVVRRRFELHCINNFMKALGALHAIRQEMHRMPNSAETYAESRAPGCRNAVYDIVGPTIKELEEVKT